MQKIGPNGDGLSVVAAFDGRSLDNTKKKKWDIGATVNFACSLCCRRWLEFFFFRKYISSDLKHTLSHKYISSSLLCIC